MISRDFLIALGRASEETSEPGFGSGDSVLHPIGFSGT
jgi:hypothetical protein